MRASASIAAIAVATLALGCGRASNPRDVCLELRASPNLNSYSNQAHVVVLDLHPLETPGGFEQLSASDLIGGAKPPGAAGMPIQMTVAPGDQIGDILIAQAVLKGRHRQLRSLVERVAHAITDDLRELRIGVPPSVAAVVVRRRW